MSVPNDKVIFESKMCAEDVIDMASYMADDEEIVLTEELCQDLEAQLSDAVLRVLDSFIDDHFS